MALAAVTEQKSRRGEGGGDGKEAEEEEQDKLGVQFGGWQRGTSVEQVRNMHEREGTWANLLLWFFLRLLSSHWREGCWFWGKRLVSGRLCLGLRRAGFLVLDCDRLLFWRCSWVFSLVVCGAEILCSILDNILWLISQDLL